MQDNWNIDELSDQAWSKMKVMLDQEMPAKGDSRKPLAFWWFWLAAAAVLPIAIVSLLWLLPLSSPEQSGAITEMTVTRQPKELTAPTEVEGNTSGAHSIIPASEQERPAVVSANTDQKSRKPAARDQLAAEINQSKDQSELLARQSADLQRTTNTLSEALPVESGPEAEEEISAEPLAEATRNDTEPAPNSPRDQALEKVLPERETELPMERFAEVKRLPDASIAPLDQLALPLSRINSYNPKSPLFLSPEINAGLISGMASGGLSGGMIALRSGLLLHDAGRWSLQTGIGLHLQRDPFTVRFRRSGGTAEEALMDPSLDTSNSPVASLSIAQAVETNDVHLMSIYLDVPVLVDWQFHRHWALAAGGRMSWLLASEWQSTGNDEQSGFNTGANYALDLGRSRELTISPLGSSSAPPTSFVLNKFYASATLGLTYRPTLRWNVRLQYQHSMTNLLESTVYEKVDRSLWLSAGFRF